METYVKVPANRNEEMFSGFKYDFYNLLQANAWSIATGL